MKKTHYLLALVFFTFLACQCSSDNREQRADEKLREIRTLIDKRQLNKAKIQIDSFHQLFPNLIEQRRQAQQLKDTITLLEAMRTQQFVDSMLLILQPQTDSLLKFFKYEPATAYESCGKFVHPTLTTLRNTNRCFLQAQVSEDMTLLIRSYYTGKRIDHNAVSLLADDNNIQAEGRMHAFDAEQHHEITTLNTEQGLELLRFISAHKNALIRVDLLCDCTSEYKYFLQDSEKKALEQTLALYINMQDVHRLELMNQQASNLVKLKTQQK